MKATICFKFDGVTLNSDACDLIEKDCFSDTKLEEYAKEYNADRFSYYLDQPNYDDGWVAVVAYVNFYFDNVKDNTPEFEDLVNKINDGEKISEHIENLGHNNSYWLYDFVES